MMYDIEHPDVTAALRYGYPSWQEDENKDCPENRALYIEEYQNELVKWLRLDTRDFGRVPGIRAGLWLPAI